VPCDMHLFVCRKVKRKLVRLSADLGRSEIGRQSDMICDHCYHSLPSRPPTASAELYRLERSQITAARRVVTVFHMLRLIRSLNRRTESSQIGVLSVAELSVWTTSVSADQSR